MNDFATLTGNQICGYGKLFEIFNCDDYNMVSVAKVMNPAGDDVSGQAQR